MDKETAVAIAKLEAAVDQLSKDNKEQKDVLNLWNSLIRTTLIKIVTWLIVAGGTGLIFGWKMPPETRKAIIEWVTK